MSAYQANKMEILTMSKRELRDYLEHVRGMATYDDEPVKLLRETALEDSGYVQVPYNTSHRAKKWMRLKC